MHLDLNRLPAEQLIRDRDGKFTPIFDRLLRSSGVDVKSLTMRSPNLNAYAERFIQALKHECLGYIIVFGHKHLDYLVSTFVDYCHTQRPHQAKRNRPLLKLVESPTAPPSSSDDILCEERLGGLIKHYYRKAA